VPAKINDSSNFFIKNITKKIIKELGYKGIICIEFFIDNENNILVNEIAPRTHNSGHYSIEGCNISQFEHQVKIMTNQIPKNSNLITPSVMINLLGEIWQDKKPDFDKIISNNVFLHLYNKRIPKKGRKMGHITITDSSLQNANAIADKIYKVL
jgi:5-(carboxyamino)imidazole ribonucleotide synthase